MSTAQIAAVITTARYGRTIDLSKFEEAHRPAIAQAIEWAENAAIIAEPYRYLPGHDAATGIDRVLVAFRESHDVEVTPSDERWYAVLDVDTQTTYDGDTLIKAWRAARGLE